MALGNDVDVGMRFSETPRAPAEIEAYVEPKTKRAAPAGVTSAMFSMLLAVMPAFVLEPVALVPLAILAFSYFGPLGERSRPSNVPDRPKFLLPVPPERCIMALGVCFDKHVFAGLLRPDRALYRH